MSIQGRTYAFEDIAITLLGGRRQVGVQSIDYSDQVEKTHAHDVGSIRPVGVGRSGYTGEGSLTLRREGFHEMLGQLREKGLPLYGVQFSAAVTYGNDDEDLTTDELPLCEFTRTQGGGKVGDTKLEVQLSFVIVQPVIRGDVPAI